MWAVEIWAILVYTIMHENHRVEWMNLSLLQVFNHVIPSTAGSGGSADASAPDDTSVLTRDERVVRFLAGDGGYAWQGEIADGLDWSASMASRTLSEMEEGDRIDRYRIGRRKVVCLPDHVPEGLRSEEPRASPRAEP